MRHVDPEVIALLALGEQVGLPEEDAHLSECDRCRGEVIALSHAAVVGRSTIESGQLLVAPSRVWDRISDELSLNSVGETPSTDSSAGANVAWSDDGVESETSSRHETGVTEGAAVHSLDTRRRRWVGVVAAAAALALVTTAGSAIWSSYIPAEQPTVLASATLEAFPNWADSTGEARLEQLPDGTRVIDVNLTAPATESGYREVWLITTDATALVSLGVVDGTAGQFAIPDGLDVERYALVDISQEPFDGDPAHSGDSIVRGQLT